MSNIRLSAVQSAATDERVQPIENPICAEQNISVALITDGDILVTTA